MKSAGYKKSYSLKEFKINHKVLKQCTNERISSKHMYSKLFETPKMLGQDGNSPNLYYRIYPSHFFVEI